MAGTFIGNTQIPNINSIEMTASADYDEINLDNDASKNMLFKKSESLEQFNISFTLLKELHPDNLPVEEQKDELKELLDRNYQSNFFVYRDFNGYLSVNSVNFPLDSDQSNIVQGEIQAVYLPINIYG